MKVLVTGGAGFVGSHVVEALLAAGHEVCVVDNLSAGQRRQVPDQVPFYQVDIGGPSLAEVFTIERPEIVNHQAAQVSVPRSVADPGYDAMVNVAGLANVLEQARRHGTRKIVFASSAAVYGNPVHLPVPEDHPLVPLSPYGLSKWAGELYLDLFRRLHGLEFTVLRYANVYGPRQDPFGEAGVVTIFVERMLAGEPVTIDGDGEQTRDFVYVGDVAAANVWVLDRGDGDTFNVGTGMGIGINRLFETLQDLTKYESRPLYGPPRPGDIRHSVLDPGRIATRLGWRASTPLTDGLMETVRYFQTQ